MKTCTIKEVTQITGEQSPLLQVAILRQRGLNPFVCPRTGRPLISEDALNSSMMGKMDAPPAFVGNASLLIWLVALSSRLWTG